MNKIVLGLVAASGVALGGSGSASANPPVVTTEGDGIVRVDVAAGEWWYCQALSLSPPFVEYQPGYYQYALGPVPLFFKFPPGSDVWINCNGSGAPFVFYGPIVKTVP